eukprot:12526317-Alexandrium_andersonii.AAC.1
MRASCALGGPFRRQVRNQHEQPRRVHSSGASGANVEVFSGAAHSKFRTPEAMLRCPWPVTSRNLKR